MSGGLFEGFLQLFGIPDVRIDANVGPFDVFLPSYTQKSEILGPKKEPRDYLTNMFMSKPDYDDPHKKVYYASFLGAKFAALSAALEVGSQKSRNPRRSMNIVAKNFLFIGGSAITYGAVCTAVANLRGKKDDIWNHAIAGASIGFIYGYSQRSSGGGAVVAAFGAICGALFKSWYQYDRNMTYWASKSRAEINFMHGGKDFRRPCWWMNTHDTQTRSERYN